LRASRRIRADAKVPAFTTPETSEWMQQSREFFRSFIFSSEPLFDKGSKARKHQSRLSVKQAFKPNANKHLMKKPMGVTPTPGQSDAVLWRQRNAGVPCFLQENCQRHGNSSWRSLSAGALCQSHASNILRSVRAKI
jgi:hypothetical protein